MAHPERARDCARWWWWPGRARAGGATRGSERANRPLSRAARLDDCRAEPAVRGAAAVTAAPGHGAGSHLRPPDHPAAELGAAELPAAERRAAELAAELGDELASGHVGHGSGLAVVWGWLGAAAARWKAAKEAAPRSNPR